MKKKALIIGNDRIVWIDICKGIAILFVVFQHACGSIYKSGISDSELLSKIISFIGSFHMPLFMIISGYLFYHAYFQKEKSSEDRKIRNQVLNLCLLYLIYSILRIVFKIIFSGEINQSIDKWDIIMIPIEGIDELWYLHSLIIIYVILYFIIKIGGENQNLLIVLLSIFSLLYIISGYNAPFGFDKVIKYLLYFNLGVLAQKLFRRVNDFSKMVIAIQFVLGIALYMLSIEYIGSEYACRVVSVLIAVILSDLCIKIGICAYSSQMLFVQKSDDWLGYIGQHTLEIYLLHVYCTSGLRGLIRILDFPVMVDIIILTTMGVVVPVIFSSLVRRMGVYNFVFKPIRLLDRLKTNGV